MPLAQRLLLKVSQVRPDHAHTVQHACVQRLTHAGRAMSMHIEILVLPLCDGFLTVKKPSQSVENWAV